MATYCFTAILVNSGAYGQMDPLVKDVVVIGPNKSGSVILEAPGDNPSADSISPVGHGLLHFYGCVTCHELPLPPFRGRWGPDLDTIGSKTRVPACCTSTLQLSYARSRRGIQRSWFAAGIE